ncbi:MAG: zinc ABC transporter substrate-binding protein [Proteobacteria bacterium]|nr:zinc ABC transporter substrate-binding protein [Pseudomonadota bacterium]
MKKNIISILLLLSVSLTAYPVFAAINVLSCEPEWAALVKELGGELVDVSSATTGAQDPHHVQARPSLISKARKADLLVCTGAELEIGWLPLLQRKTSNPAIRDGADGYFMASDFVSMLGVPSVLDRSQGDVHAMGNPHIQTDPNNITDVAEALNERLQLIDPENADSYQQRYEDFSQRWQQALKRWNRQAKNLQGKHIIVHHRSWVYMNDWIGLKEVAALEPKPGVPPTAEHLAGLLKKMQRKPADAIIYAAYQSSRSAHWLSEKTGIKAVKLPFTVGGSEGVDSLFDLYDVTLKQLEQAMR